MQSVQVEPDRTLKQSLERRIRDTFPGSSAMFKRPKRTISVEVSLTVRSSDFDLAQLSSPKATHRPACTSAQQDACRGVQARPGFLRLGITVGASHRSALQCSGGVRGRRRGQRVVHPDRTKCTRRLVAPKNILAPLGWLPAGFGRMRVSDLAIVREPDFLHRQPIEISLASLAASSSRSSAGAGEFRPARLWPRTDLPPGGLVSEGRSDLSFFVVSRCQGRSTFCDPRNACGIGSEQLPAGALCERSGKGRRAWPSERKSDRMRGR